MNEDQAITFIALFGKASTTVDGGWSITLQIGQDEAHKLLQLAQFRDQPLQVAIVPLEISDRFTLPQI